MPKNPTALKLSRCLYLGECFFADIYVVNGIKNHVFDSDPVVEFSVHITILPSAHCLKLLYTCTDALHTYFFSAMP